MLLQEYHRKQLNACPMSCMADYRCNVKRRRTSGLLYPSSNWSIQLCHLAVGLPNGGHGRMCVVAGLGTNDETTSPSQWVYNQNNLSRILRFVFCAGGWSICVSVNLRFPDYRSYLIPKARPDDNSSISWLFSRTARSASSVVPRCTPFGHKGWDILAQGHCFCLTHTRRVEILDKNVMSYYSGSGRQLFLIVFRST